MTAGSETLSGDGSPSHPTRPSTRERRQTWQTGSHDNRHRWLLWKQHTVKRMFILTMNTHTFHVLTQHYLFASIKDSDAKVPSWFTTVRKIPFSMRTVPSACGYTAAHSSKLIYCITKLSSDGIACTWTVTETNVTGCVSLMRDTPTLGTLTRAAGAQTHIMFYTGTQQLHTS